MENIIFNTIKKLFCTHMYNVRLKPGTFEPQLICLKCGKIKKYKLCKHRWIRKSHWESVFQEDAYYQCSKCGERKYE